MHALHPDDSHMLKENRKIEEAKKRWRRRR
jgi:hypothetical protein